jgi:hypothetical protein
MAIVIAIKYPANPKNAFKKPEIFAPKAPKIFCILSSLLAKNEESLGEKEASDNRQITPIPKVANPKNSNNFFLKNKYM